jgi:hypothetical protein
MSGEEFRYWLTPLGGAQLWIELDRQETCRQDGITEATLVADELMAETEAAAVWREVATDVELAELAEVAANPWPEAWVPSVQRMMRMAS